MARILEAAIKQLTQRRKLAEQKVGPTSQTVTTQSTGQHLPAARQSKAAGAALKSTRVRKTQKPMGAHASRSLGRSFNLKTGWPTRKPGGRGVNVRDTMPQTSARTWGLFGSRRKTP